MAYLILAGLLSVLMAYAMFNKWGSLTDKILSCTIVPFAIFFLTLLCSIGFIQAFSVQEKFNESDIWTSTSSDTTYISNHGDNYLTTDYVDGNKYYLYLDSDNKLNKVRGRSWRIISIRNSNSVKPMLIKTFYKTDKWYVYWFGMYSFMEKSTFIIPENSISKVK